MQTFRIFFLTTAVAVPLLAQGSLAQAQTQVTTDQSATSPNPTRTQVFRESNATSGQYSQRWVNDRDAERDRRNQENDRRNGNRRDNREGTVVVGSNRGTVPGTNTVILQSYPTYPGYAPYPSYPYGYNGYNSSVNGSSVTISTPGYNDGTFNVFPWTTTVTTFSNTPVAPNYYGYRNYQNCQPYSNYPAYPTYVNPNVQGYRGAASPNYYFNGGSFPSGAYVTGSISNQTSGFSAGYSTGRTTVNIGGRR